MTEFPLVSIIVRTQGARPRLLARALESLLAQSYPSLEVLLVEDGGERSHGIFDEYCNKRAGFLRYLPIRQCGRSEAANAGLRASRGDLIGFLDDDDELLPDHVESLVAELARCPDADVAYALSQPMACAGLGSDSPGDERPLDAIGDIPFSRTKLWLRNRIAFNSALFRRRCYLEEGGLDPGLEFLEDWDLWLRYSARAEFVGVDRVTSIFRVPASKERLLERARLHEKWREHVLRKHAEMTAVHRLEDVVAIPTKTVDELPFRGALGLAVDRGLSRVWTLLRGRA
jgi:glycosyltransferase involved in cell wall biosynthesis